MPIREMSQNEICHTDKMAQHMIKTPLRQNATLENCHKTNYHRARGGTKDHVDKPLE